MRRLVLLAACGVAHSVHADVPLPAEGVWRFPASNGSGLTLDVRDSTIGIGLYTYDEDGDSVWYSGAGQLVDGVLDTDLSLYRETAPGVVEAVGAPREFRLSFSDSTHATLSFDGTTGIATEHLAFGADYMAGWTPQGIPAHALPDLRGHWLFATRPSDPMGLSTAYDVEFAVSSVSEDGRTALFRSIDYPVDARPDALRTYEMRCAPFEATTRCDLVAGIVPVESGDVPRLVGSFDPRDLSPNRAAGHDEFGDVFGFRVPGDVQAAPQPGIWQIVGRNGSGMTLDVRENGAAVGLFSYDAQGNATWSLAQGPIVQNTLAATLTAFSGGSCLACEQQDPEAQTVTRALSLQFVSATRALLVIDNAEPITLVLLPYGTGYVQSPMENDPLEIDFGPHPVPRLSGRWAFTQGDVATQREPDAGVALDFIDHEVTPADDGVHARRISARAADIARGLVPEPFNEQRSLDCGTFGGAAAATCELFYRAVPDSDIDDPPAFESHAVGDLSDLSGTRYIGTGTGGLDVPVWGFQLPTASGTP